MVIVSEYIRRCPECRSKDIVLWMKGRLGDIYWCRKCGYRGPFVMEEYEKDSERVNTGPKK